ncbi:MAG: 50S ribosomal protein L15 [Candidatus Saccharimonadales bacterium]
MKYNDLKLNRQKKPNRVGRGIAAGQGKTAGRGTKGQKSRTGYSMRPGFEGGQNPLMQRLPKLHGYRALKPKAEVVYTEQLNQFSGKSVDTALLASHGLVSSQWVRVKLIVKGEVTAKVNVKLPAASQLAIQQIETAGGSFEVEKRQPIAKQGKPASDKKIHTKVSVKA